MEKLFQATITYCVKTWHFRAFKGKPIASVVTKNAPEFCDVIVINKGQVHSKKEAMKPKLLDGWQHPSIHFLVDGEAKQSIPLWKPNGIVHTERSTCTCFLGSFFFSFMNDKYREMCRNGTYDTSHANIVNNKNLLCNNSLWNNRHKNNNILLPHTCTQDGNLALILGE